MSLPNMSHRGVYACAHNLGTRFVILEELARQGFLGLVVQYFPEIERRDALVADRSIGGHNFGLGSAMGYTRLLLGQSGDVEKGIRSNQTSERTCCGLVSGFLPGPVCVAEDAQFKFVMGSPIQPHIFMCSVQLI